MTEPEYVLREFVCVRCGHKVVVHPELPLDYMPTVCTPCWEKCEEPKRAAYNMKLACIGAKLLSLLGDDKMLKQVEALYGADTVERINREAAAEGRPVG